jgi:hypothetical protein
MVAFKSDHGRGDMRTTYFKLYCVLITGTLILAACNMPGGNAPAETSVSPTESPTQEVTATLAATDTATEVPPTETPTVTPTETPVPEPSETATPEPPKAEVLRETNCRVGPAGNYDLVAAYQAGQKLEVVAKDLGNGYWFVRNPDKPEEQCYLLGQNIKISGETAALPKFTPQPSPTAGLFVKVTFKKFDTCKGQDFALFIVENTGGVPYRSAYIKVTDLKLNKSVEQAVSAFDLYVGCVLAKNIAPLNPGGTGYLTSPRFTWNAAANKLRAVIMVCTEKALKGTCITQSPDIKP